ncbi:MAG: hypothetical protein LJE61_09070 [Thiocapsa sp.]|jgi:hypothetical protein|nr:hypothetical protein [Thiocapsa sp.]MCG6896480.1 hypothetical protein [Thiocapsa sp.]MCG6985331.1 hypothetical protein [Thiocapsa sp.]
MRAQRVALIGIALATALVATARGEIAGVQFSADMISRGPDGQVVSGRMYVGDGRMRMEMTQQGREIVRISDQNRRMEWILFPDQQSYIEQGGSEGQGGGDAPAPLPSAESDPCAGMPGMSCRRLGQEDVSGRPAVKWEMVMTHEGKTLKGVQWIDAERGLPLKHEMPNGETMELKLVGNESIEGRQVEKWEMTTTLPNEQPSRTFQWYDPQLKLSVREEFPGGYVRELKSIRIAEQPDHLFTVPAGYTRMEMPSPEQ